MMRRACRQRRARIGIALAGIVILIAVLGPFIAPHSPDALVTTPYAPPSSAYPLGGDTLGRDALSRVLNGGWVLLLMALAATLLGVGLGALAGITAAYLGGRVDGWIMRTVDVILCFPPVVFALLLVSVAGAKLWLVIVAVGLSHAPQVSRVLRAVALDVGERPFVKASELNGVSSGRVMASEILPNLATPIVVETGLRLTYSIVIISGLAFLGFGQAPPSPNWGFMISENRLGLVENPWPVLVPAALIAILTIGVNMFGDAVARVSLGAAGRSEELTTSIESELVVPGADTELAQG